MYVYDMVLKEAQEELNYFLH